ncbi:hypothetical protein IT570_01670 [Candidatus Sumerlaeota bacterium]|nr:hypothetical protein [Candidatus Sumerlaeota bacterium]
MDAYKRFSAARCVVLCVLNLYVTSQSLCQQNVNSVISPELMTAAKETNLAQFFVESKELEKIGGETEGAINRAGSYLYLMLQPERLEANFVDSLLKNGLKNYDAQPYTLNSGRELVYFRWSREGYEYQSVVSIASTCLAINLDNGPQEKLSDTEVEQAIKTMTGHLFNNAHLLVDNATLSKKGELKYHFDLSDGKYYEFKNSLSDHLQQKIQTLTGPTNEIQTPSSEEIESKMMESLWMWDITVYSDGRQFLYVIPCVGIGSTKFSEDDKWFEDKVLSPIPSLSPIPGAPPINPFKELPERPWAPKQ